MTMWVCHLAGEDMASECTMGGRQAGSGSAMLCAMICRETRHPGCGFNFDTNHLLKMTYQWYSKMAEALSAG